MDHQTEHDISIRELESAFKECFRCMLSAGMQHVYPRAVVKMIHRAATALQYTLPQSALQMLQIFNDNSWQPLYTDESDGVDVMVQGGQGQRVENAKPEMEDLLKRWEEMGLQDKSKVLSGEDEVVGRSGSADTT